MQTIRSYIIKVAKLKLLGAKAKRVNNYLIHVVLKKKHVSFKYKESFAFPGTYSLRN